jgi:acetyl-CoA C-acetyltransferase
MRKVVIVAAKRTPIGRNLGALCDIKPTSFAATALAGTLNSIKFPAKDLDEVILGNVLSAGLGQHVTKQAALEAKIPDTVPCMMVNRICGSGMISMIVGANSIKAGYRNIVLCGGFESMSRTPHTIWLRKGINGQGTLNDSLVCDGLTDAITGDGMGLCTERVGKRLGFTRADMDNVAVRSYQNAIKAKDAKILEREIVGVKTKTGIFKDDEELGKFDAEKMKKLRAAFVENGQITAANASKVSDGAQGILIMGEDIAQQRGIKPLARIIAYEEASTFPGDFTVGAIESAKKVLKVAHMEVKDMDYFEFNEAFAILPLLGQKLMGIDINKVNVHGGAIALGHPLGYFSPKFT